MVVHRPEPGQLPRLGEAAGQGDMSPAPAELTARGARSVLHVTTVPASLNFVREQVRYSKAHGWTVHVMSSPGERLTTFAEQEAVVAHEAPLCRHIAPLRDVHAILYMTRVMRALRPTILHADTPKAGLLAMIAGTLAGSCIRMYELRGLPMETATGWRRLLLRNTERLACHLAHRVVCDSPSVQRVLLTEGLCQPHKCVTPLGGRGSGVDAAGRFNPARIPHANVQALRAQLELPDDALVIGYVGRLARIKGIVELEQAWGLLRRRNPDAHLLIIGAEDEHHQKIPVQVLANLLIDNRVHFTGRVADPCPYYALMDLLVLPTYREGMPNVLLEAAAMELPIVTTRVTGAVDAVDDGRTALVVDPYSAAQLARAMETYLRDPELRMRHGRAGRARMLREFRTEPLCAAFVAEYEALMAERAAPRTRRRFAQWARRAFDITLSSALLLLMSPIMLVIAVAVQLALGSPVLFRQVRIGAQGRPFTLHKFRTMHHARGSDGELLPAEARLTRFGRWLRRTSLDELPELWDVWRGCMSLIGPRPLLPQYLPLYSERQARRHEVLPGITGWAQVHGRNAISWEEKLELDVWYVEHGSPRVDLQILLRTIPQVLAGRDVSPHGRAVMEPFRGQRT